jgi:hypothetical protein
MCLLPMNCKVPAGIGKGQEGILMIPHGKVQAENQAYYD